MTAVRREVLKQRDLFLGKRLHFAANGDDLSQKHVILAQRDTEHCATTGLDSHLHLLLDLRVVQLRQISDLDEPLSVQQSPHRELGAGSDPLLQLPSQGFWQAPDCNRTELLAVVSLQRAVGDPA